MRKNCSSDREKLLKFEAEGREFAKVLRSLEQFVQTVKGHVRTTFGNRMIFLTFSFFSQIYYKLVQLEFKLEKIIGIQKLAGKVRKGIVKSN